MRPRVTNSSPSWVALILAATLIAGCGGETPPAEAAPELADQLALVDRAVGSGDEMAIRRRLDSLVTATESARDAGRIDEAQADRILAAADALLARLPAPQQEPEPTAPSPTPSATPPPPEEGGEGDEGEGDGGDEEEKKKAKEEAEKRREEREKQREEEAKKREEAKKQEEDEDE
jgi:hypothetical protein